MTDVLLQCESMRERFRHWHAEHESLEAQLSESLAALSAYQSHLDAWQQQLAKERDQFRKEREHLERDQAAANGQLETAGTRERELMAALEEQKEMLERERVRWAKEMEQLRASESQAKASPTGTAAQAREPAADENPVLGSLMEQFGKLSQQRAIERQALKKSTR